MYIVFCVEETYVTHRNNFWQEGFDGMVPKKEKFKETVNGW